MQQQRRHFYPVSLAQRVALAAVALGFALVAIGELTVPAVGAKILGAVMLLGSLTVLYRGLRTGVVMDDRGITDRGFERTRLIRWEDIREVTVADGSNGSGRRIVTTALTLSDGSLVALKGTARSGGLWAFAQLEEDIQRHMELRRPA